MDPVPPSPGPTAPTPGRRPRQSGVVIPEQPRWHGRLAARLLWLIGHLIALTIRWRFTDRSGLFDRTPRPRAIFALWHNRLGLSFFIYRRYVRGRSPGSQMAALVSASRDGGLFARVLELFGARPVRGSSSRRGGQALKELVTAARDGLDIALTPDGPRGPRYAAQEGVIVAAQLTGLPIVPVGYRLHWKKSLRSWDAFQVPLPFSRCDVTFGGPLVVPRDLDPTRRAALRTELEARIRELSPD